MGTEDFECPEPKELAIRSVHNFLQDVGIIQKNTDGSYRFVIAEVATFVRSKLARPSPRVTPEGAPEKKKPRRLSVNSQGQLVWLQFDQNGTLLPDQITDDLTRPKEQEEEGGYQSNWRG